VSRIAIVGAGWAGLAAAVAAAQRGHDVTLFEVARTLGGRARTLSLSMPDGSEALVDNGQVIPVWWDDVQEDGNPAPQKQMEGLSIPTFPQLHRQVKGTKPSGELWDAYKTIFEINSTLQRLLALPPGAPRAASDALRTAIERLNNDKDFAAEAMKVIQFVPEYPTAPDMSNKISSMLVASPNMRKFVNDYMRNVPKR